MGNDLKTSFFAIRNILNGIPKDKDYIRLNTVIYGKTIEGIPIKSRETLTQRQMVQYRFDLLNIYKNWSLYGHEDWIIKQISGLYFTVKFIRKDSEEGRKYLNGEKNE